MSTDNRSATTLEDIRIPVRLRLSVLFSSLMFCYMYGDYSGSTDPASSRG